MFFLTLDVGRRECPNRLETDKPKPMAAKLPKKFRAHKEPVEKPAKRGPGRPRIEIRLDILEAGARIGCQIGELAAMLKMSESHLYARIAAEPPIGEAIARGRETGRATLRRAQWQAAMAKNPTMLIWLGKQMLGQRDNIDTRHGVDEGLERLLLQLHQADGGRGTYRGRGESLEPAGASAGEETVAADVAAP